MAARAAVVTTAILLLSACASSFAVVPWYTRLELGVNRVAVEDEPKPRVIRAEPLRAAPLRVPLPVPRPPTAPQCSRC